MVQLRDKELSPRDLLSRARLASRVCHDHGVPFILNDRPDLALEVGADGVHLGQDDAPWSLARSILGAGAIVGGSTHSVEDLDRTLGEPVDYISAGPVVPTPTKPGRRPTGSAYVTLAVERADVPVFVTGGVDPAGVESLVEAGAAHFVVVRYLTGSSDPEASARALRTAIASALSKRADRR